MRTSSSRCGAPRVPQHAGIITVQHKSRTKVRTLNRRWIYALSALVAAGAVTVLYHVISAGGEDQPTPTVPLIIPPRDQSDETVRRIPLEPAPPEIDVVEPAAKSKRSSLDEGPSMLPGILLEEQQPALEPLPDQIVLAAAKRNRLVEDGIPFGSLWVLVGEVFSEHAWVELVDRQGQVIWHQSAEDSSRTYWQVMSNNLDLTLDGKTDLHLFSWTGAMHCCIDHIVFDAARLSKPHVFYQGHGDAQQFRRLGGGAPVIWIPDTAAYLWGSFAGSAEFWIPIRYNGHTFGPAREFMSRPAEVSRDAAREALQTMLDAYRAGDEVPKGLLAVLMQAVGDEVYSGRTRSAQNLISDVWPKDLPGEADFRCIAIDWFKIVEHADTLESLNGMPLDRLLKRPAKCPDEASNRWY